MSPGSESPGGDLLACKRRPHRPSSGRWGENSQSVGVRLISFHFVRFAPGGLARARHTNPWGIVANRQGAVVPWVEGIDSGSAEHPPRFVSVPGETTRWVLRPTSVTAAPVRQ